MVYLPTFWLICMGTVGKHNIHGCYGLSSNGVRNFGTCRIKTQKGQKRSGPAADGRNPANKLRLVVYPIIYSRVYNSRWLFGISSINTMMFVDASLKKTHVFYQGAFEKSTSTIFVVVSHIVVSLDVRLRNFPSLETNSSAN